MNTITLRMLLLNNRNYFLNKIKGYITTTAKLFEDVNIFVCLYTYKFYSERKKTFLTGSYLKR